MLAITIKCLIESAANDRIQHHLSLNKWGQVTILANIRKYCDLTPVLLFVLFFINLNNMLCFKSDSNSTLD